MVEWWAENDDDDGDDDFFLRRGRLLFPQVSVVAEGVEFACVTRKCLPSCLLCASVLTHAGVRALVIAVGLGYGHMYRHR